ncbi:hypothetical protein [Caudoviricetes sp.]|nr:hypothetical protein [Caudoviricetes sp.]UOF78378.1 hypothetical protein [Bacteriophage sp.]
MLGKRWTLGRITIDFLNLVTVSSLFGSSLRTLVIVDLSRWRWRSTAIDCSPVRH